jgi:hypothetical protein
MRIHTIFAAVLSLTVIASAQNYEIDWYTIASGGGHSESINYQADGTIGQPIVGQSSSENYTLKSGYWVGFLARGDCVYLPGDCNHNGIALELGDVIAMIGMYRGSIGPYYICDCGVDPPGTQFAATADPNGNCVAFELGDVVTEIGAYRGSTTASGCQDCPGSLRLIPGGDQPLVMPRLKAKAVRKASQ